MKYRNPDTGVPLHLEYIKSRIKTPESNVKKLKRYGYESSIDNMVSYVNDIAGIPIVCSFTSDIYKLAEMIGKQNDLTVISIKDYIKNPKESGYKSYHMLVTVPIFLSDRVIDTKVEIQIRTMAMDFWASLEHKIYYKFEGNAPGYITDYYFLCCHSFLHFIYLKYFLFCQMSTSIFTLYII